MNSEQQWPNITETTKYVHLHGVLKDLLMKYSVTLTPQNKEKPELD